MSKSNVCVAIVSLVQNVQKSTDNLQDMSKEKGFQETFASWILKNYFLLTTSSFIMCFAKRKITKATIIKSMSEAITRPYMMPL